MNDLTFDHTLIEYVLTLLSIPEHSSMDNDQLVEAIKQTGKPFSLNLQNIQAAHDMIQFMDEMPGGFLIYHADGGEQIIHANKALLRIFQCQTLKEFQELTRNSFRGMVYPEDLDAVEQSIKEQIAHSKFDLDYVEYRIVRKDGQIRWIEDYGHFIHSKSIGDIFYVFIGDATEKKNRQLEEHVMLLNEKKKLRKIIEKYDQERSLINQEHLRRLEVIEGLSINYESILYADLDADKIFPYRLSSRTKHQFHKKYCIIGLKWYLSDYVDTWVHPEDRELVAKITNPDYIREQLSSHRTYYLNYRVLKNGKIQYIQLRIVNVSKKKPASQIVLGYRRVDVEVRREMKQNEILEEALTQANLAIIAKNTFLSNMSHDMRTPLNAIFGFTDLAKKYLHDPVNAECYLNKIERSSRQLLELIEKVLDLSWAESNDVKLNESECSLLEITEEVYHTMLPQANEKNITFTMDQSALTHYGIIGDQDKLKQLLLYLISNAITYTNPNGSVELIVKEQKMLPDHYMLCQFIVKDTGIGISKDFLKHIFEPFEREKNTTSSGIHGTGLSLTIAKKIASMMSGDIKIDSTVGEGSTFTATLRLQTQDCLLPHSTDSNTFVPQNQRILLVEDNMINLEIETEILQGLGFLIETAVNGRIAVEKMENSKPGHFDLILMDIQMPEMDGRQAARAIRELHDQTLAQIPIIALSANAFESDKRLSMESGMDAHLTKPIDIPILLETIGTVQRKSRAI